MRFELNFKKSQPGATRRKGVFLFFPKNLNGEWRWLCYTKIFQIYSGGGTETGYDYTFAGWKDVGWSDQIEKIEIGEPKIGFSGSIRSEFKIIYKGGI